MKPLPTMYPNLAELGRSFGPRRLGRQTGTPLAASAPLELDRIIRFAAEKLDVAAVCATIVDGNGRLVVSCHGITVPTALLVTHAVRRHLSSAGSPLVVGDASLDSRMASSPTVRDGTVRACLGISLGGDDRNAIGSLLVLDPAPRRWEQPHLDCLRDLSIAVRRLCTPADPRYLSERIGPASGQGIPSLRRSAR